MDGGGELAGVKEGAPPGGVAEAGRVPFVPFTIHLVLNTKVVLPDSSGLPCLLHRGARHSNCMALLALPSKDPAHAVLSHCP